MEHVRQGGEKSDNASQGECDIFGERSRSRTSGLRTSGGALKDLPDYRTGNTGPDPSHRTVPFGRTEPLNPDWG